MRKHISRSPHVILVVGAIAAIAFAAMSATPTLAARGGKNGATQAASTIALAGSAPTLGQTVTFATSATGLAGWEWPMVGVSCSQAGALVYGALDTPDASFLLGGNSSLWLERGGGADCDATLYAYGWRGGQETIRTLAWTPFYAAAP